MENNNTELNKVYERIQKLFALAKRAGSEAESQNAALRARELLLKYNLSEKDITPSEEKREALARNTIQSYCHQWMTYIATRISEYYRCKVLKDNRNHMIIIGLEDDVQIFTQIIAYVFESFLKCFKDRIKKDPEYQSLSTYGKQKCYHLYQNSYTVGYTKALVDKLEEQNRVLSECRDLVLCVPAVVNDYISQNCRQRTSKMKSSTAIDYSGYGYTDGMRNGLNAHSRLDYAAA